MKTQQLKRWQVILGVIGFLLIMGLVGKMDRDSEIPPENPIAWQPDQNQNWPTFCEARLRK